MNWHFPGNEVAWLSLVAFGHRPTSKTSKIAQSDLEMTINHLWVSHKKVPSAMPVPLVGNFVKSRLPVGSVVVISQGRCSLEFLIRLFQLVLLCFLQWTSQ